MADQKLGFCTTDDGVRICYATVGEGPPLVKTPELADPPGIRVATPHLGSLMGGAVGQSHGYQVRPTWLRSL